MLRNPKRQDVVGNRCLLGIFVACKDSAFIPFGKILFNFNILCLQASDASLLPVLCRPKNVPILFWYLKGKGKRCMSKRGHHVTVLWSSCDRTAVMRWPNCGHRMTTVWSTRYLFNMVVISSMLSPPQRYMQGTKLYIMWELASMVCAKKPSWAILWFYGFPVVKWVVLLFCLWLYGTELKLNIWLNLQKAT